MKIDKEMVTKVNGTLIMEIFEATGQNELNHEINLSSSWYDIDQFLLMMNSFPFDTIVKIGRAVPKHATFPPNITTFEQIMETLNDAYHMNHLNGIGNYTVSRTSESSYFIDCQTIPYPVAFHLGLIQGLGDKFNRDLDVCVKQMIGGGSFEIEIKPSGDEYSI